MLKMTRKATDFNGNPYEEEVRFNLTKAELTEMELSKDGGLTKHIEMIVKAKNNEEIMNVFKKILKKAYGELSEDGRRFIKTDQFGYSLGEKFAQTQIYSDLFMELATNDEKAAEFINALIPKTPITQNAVAPVSN